MKFFVDPWDYSVRPVEDADVMHDRSGELYYDSEKLAREYANKEISAEIRILQIDIDLLAQTRREHRKALLALETENDVEKILDKNPLINEWITGECGSTTFGDNFYE